MRIRTMDKFLGTLPNGTPIELEARSYGLRQISGVYCGRAVEDPRAIVIEGRSRHVVAIESVESVCCPVDSADDAANRLHESVPVRAHVVVSIGAGAAVSGAFEGVTERQPPHVSLDRDSGTTTVPLDDVTGIILERPPDSG